MAFKNERLDLGEGAVRKPTGVTIKTEYDDDGKPVRVSRLEDSPKEAPRSVESPKGVGSRLRGVGSKLSKALAKKEMSEAEIDAAIRITNKKASLQRAKRRLSDERRETVRSNINTFGQFVRDELPKGKKNNGSGDSGYDFFGMGGRPSGRGGGFDFNEWMQGGSRKKALKSGNDILKDYYGM